jgi:hypothetical protein
MPAEIDDLPGSAAPTSGTYCLLNVFGAVVGDPVRVPQGNHLPPAPRGFTWRLVQKVHQDQE